MERNMGELRVEKVSVTSVGTAGNAIGTATSGVVYGWIEDVMLDYHGSAAATTDVTIAYTTPFSGNILAVANTNADGLYTPRAKPVDLANSAITNAHARFAVNGAVTLNVAESDAVTDCVTAYIRYEKAGK